MFSVDGFIRLNLFLRGVYRLAYLNLLWLAGTLLGLVVFGVGPASYALAAYIDRWFRLGETPPVTRAFIGHFRERYWNAAAVGWILLAATGITVTNIFSVTDWFLQFANVVALIAVGVIALYVFPVMAATHTRGVLRQITTALLLGIGSLHWTLVAALGLGLATWVLVAHALPLLVFFGVAIPAATIGFITRVVFGSRAERASHQEAGIPTPARLHPARGITE